MTPPKMPRGAIPTPRSELAASEPYHRQGSPEIFVPSGEEANSPFRQGPALQVGGVNKAACMSFIGMIQAGTSTT